MYKHIYKQQTCTMYMYEHMNNLHSCTFCVYTHVVSHVQRTYTLYMNKGGANLSLLLVLMTLWTAGRQRCLQLVSLSS